MIQKNEPETDENGDVTVTHEYTLYSVEYKVKGGIFSVKDDRGNHFAVDPTRLRHMDSDDRDELPGVWNYSDDGEVDL